MIFGLLQSIDSLTQLAGTDTAQAINKAVKDTTEVVEKSFSNITFDYAKIEEGNGVLITIVGMGVVFISLALLSVFFVYLTKLFQISQLRKKKELGCEECKDEDIINTSGEIDAAISLALHLHFSERHDFENTVLTINKVQRTYSPWSSKIYGLRNYPRK